MSTFLKSTFLAANVIVRGARCGCPAARPYTEAPTYVVTFLRHGESTWNACNVFTGWYDAPLSDKGIAEAHNAHRILEKENMFFDIVFTSPLKRAKDTVFHMFGCEGCDIPVVEDCRLNQSHFGNLTGLNRCDMIRVFGERQVLLWRRGYDNKPPPMKDTNPYLCDIKDTFPDTEVPRTESLKMTLHRTVDFWLSTIVPEIRAGRRVLMVAHHSNLRALVKYLDDLSDDEIIGVNFDRGMPFTYTLDMYMKPLRNKSMRYLSRKEKSKMH